MSMFDDAVNTLVALPGRLLSRAVALSNGGAPVMQTGQASGAANVHVTNVADAAGLASQTTSAAILAYLANLATQTTLAALKALADTPTTPTAITKSDDTVTTAITAKGIKVGGAGNLVVKGVAGGDAVTYAAVAGDYFPCQVSRVMAATTATGLVGLS